jgi:hypothetical protein
MRMPHSSSAWSRSSARCAVALACSSRNGRGRHTKQGIMMPCGMHVPGAWYSGSTGRMRLPYRRHRSSWVGTFTRAPHPAAAWPAGHGTGVRPGRCRIGGHGPTAPTPRTCTTAGRGISGPPALVPVPPGRIVARHAPPAAVRQLHVGYLAATLAVVGAQGFTLGRGLPLQLSEGHPPAATRRHWPAPLQCRNIPRNRGRAPP